MSRNPIPLHDLASTWALSREDRRAHLAAMQREANKPAPVQPKSKKWNP